MKKNLFLFLSLVWPTGSFAAGNCNWSTSEPWENVPIESASISTEGGYFPRTNEYYRCGQIHACGKNLKNQALREILPAMKRTCIAAGGVVKWLDVGTVPEPSYHGTNYWTVHRTGISIVCEKRRGC